MHMHMAKSSLTLSAVFYREAANGIKFAQLFGDIKGVHVPHMYQEITTARVLVMEWVDGVKLRTASSAERSLGTKGTNTDLKLVEIGVRCSLEQMLDEGFYHADPHPGNLRLLRRFFSLFESLFLFRI